MGGIADANLYGFKRFQYSAIKLVVGKVQKYFTAKALM